MLDNCQYNKVKILHELSSLAWFIEKHAIENANKAGDTSCIKEMEEIKKDLVKNIDRLKNILK